MNNTIIVIREAFHESPDKVLGIEYSEDTRTVIARHYPGAVFDNIGGFDTPDGGSYLYDRTNVIR